MTPVEFIRLAADLQWDRAAAVLMDNLPPAAPRDAEQEFNRQFAYAKRRWREEFRGFLTELVVSVVEHAARTQTTETLAALSPHGIVLLVNANALKWFARRVFESAPWLAGVRMGFKLETSPADPFLAFLVEDPAAIEAGGLHVNRINLEPP